MLVDKKYERSISTQRAESLKKKDPYDPPYGPGSQSLLSLSYHLISYHIRSSYIISRQHIFFSNKKTQHVFFSQKKTSSSLRRRHSMSPDHTYRLQTHHLRSIHMIQGPDLKKFDFSTLSQLHPMTFGLCLGIITDTFQQVFEFSKNHFSEIYLNNFLNIFCLK